MHLQGFFLPINDWLDVSALCVLSGARRLLVHDRHEAARDARELVRPNAWNVLHRVLQQLALLLHLP